MVDPSTLAAPLSPRALAAAQHVTAIEAELVQLRADVAPTLERIAALERSLEAVELAAHPKQAALLDIGEALPPVPPLREPSRMAEELLRAAMVPRATDPLFVRCSICEADPGHPCRAVEGQAFDGSPHVNRAADAEEWANAPTIWRLTIPRDSMHRGELKCAHALAAGARPLLVEENRTKGSVVYRLTADGETVARALPAKVPS